MGTINVSLPTDGSTADVADYNTPINTIVDEINGGLDNTNIDAAAAIAGSKLADNSIDLEAKASADTGWREVTDSWTYASATTITVPTDATTKYSVGDKIRITNSTVKYFYITAVAATTLTITGGTSYTLANAAISDVSYSKAATPFGFPHVMNFTPAYAQLTVGNATNTGSFTIVGKNIFVTTELTLGSTSSVSTGPTMTLPVTGTAHGTTLTHWLGFAYLHGSVGVVRWVSTTTVDFTVMNAASTYVVQNGITASVPTAWTTGNIITLNFSYRIA